MHIYLCEQCNTLAWVTQKGNTITINKCLCSIMKDGINEN